MNLRNLTRFVATFVASTAVGFVIAPAQADWADDHCNNDGPTHVDRWSREEASSYALTANGDGYDWGGGCWNGNGQDDTPAQDTDHNSVGEGPDCSGFTFKSWAMALDFSNHKRRWKIRTDQHGPYTADSFHDGVGAANVLASKAYGNTIRMDAFASSGHIGMIFSESSDGQDRIIEAKDQQTNTGIFTRSYRSSTSFVAVRRGNWDPYCPQCPPV